MRLEIKMRRKYYVTGNPFIDWGICNFYQEFKNSDKIVCLKEPEKSFIEMDILNPSEMKSLMKDKLKNMRDLTFALSNQAKILNNETGSKLSCLGTDISKKYSLSEKEVAVLKKAKVPTKKEIFLCKSRDNLYALTKDVTRISEEEDALIKDFLDFESPRSHCNFCSQETLKDAYKVTQYINPMANKHHNNKIRDPSKSNDYLQSCGYCRIFSIFTLLDPNVPYFLLKNKKYLMLPKISDLSLLYKVMRNLKSTGNLKSFEDPNFCYTSTNITHFRSKLGPYVGLLTLLYSITNKLSTKEEENWTELDSNDKKQVTDWFSIPYIKSKNVNFGSFHVIKSSSDSSKITETLPLPNEKTGYNVIEDIFKRPPVQDALIMDSFARGLLDFDTSRVSDFFMLLLRQKSRANFSYFQKFFIKHFCEVKGMDNELTEHMRIIGSNLGRHLGDRMSLMTKLYNASSKESFKQVLVEAFYELYKISQNKASIAFPIKPDIVEALLKMIDKDGWKESKDILFIHACITAINKKVSSEKNRNSN